MDSVPNEERVRVQGALNGVSTIVLRSLCEKIP